MTLLERFQRLRKHLVDNWEYAEDWAYDSYNREGIPCLVILETKDHEFVWLAWDQSEVKRKFKEQLKMTENEDFIKLFRQIGKVGLLDRMDRAIFRLKKEEFDNECAASR